MIYDLTHAISEELPVYPGDPHVKIEQVGVLERDGYADRLLRMGTHNGTHIDAPTHMLAGGKKLKDYPIDRFIVKAICIDVRDGFNASQLQEAITEPGLAVMFYTGASNYFYKERYWHDYTVLDSATVQVLIDEKVSLVGIDTGSFDSEDDFPVHKALLGADVLLIENLANLEPLLGKVFKLYALPLKLEADGAPVRAVADIG